MEDIMKTAVRITLATILIAESFTFAAPAFATRAREAIAGCVQPRCHFRVDDDGGVLIVVKGGKGTVIYCPPGNGVCGVVRTAPQNLGHSGENGNAQPQNGNGGNTDGGGQVGGPG
jgi:hypothetical protein